MAKAADRLTKRTLDALRNKAERDRTFSCFTADAGQPGLYAWARRGRVRFVFAYRPPRGGSRNRLQIDEYGAITLEQARRVAQDLRGKVAAGIDPQEERRHALTVAGAVDGYLADLRRRAETGARRGKRSGYVSARRRLERHVVPRLGSLRLRDVTSDHVRKLHRAMAGLPSRRTARSLPSRPSSAGPIVPRSSRPAPTPCATCRSTERKAHAVR